MRRMISDKQLNDLKAPDVIITGVPESAVQGTLTQEQIEMLLANDKSRIIFNNEYYYLNDKFHKNGVLTYTHSGYDETGIDKYLNITVTTRDWVLTETNIGGGNLKIIELDTVISQATITQEQMDIFFPKDSSGNIHKPDYYIVISDTITSAGNSGYQYLGFWSPTSIRFNRLGTNGYYTWTIGPNDTKFTQTNTRIPHLYQHNIYIKTSDLYIFITFISDASSNYNNMLSINSFLAGKHISCSGYLTQGPQGPITSLTLNNIEEKYYFSLADSGKDYAFFQASDVTKFTDEVIDLYQR